MEGLSPHQITVFFLAVAILLGFARMAAEVAQWLHQPAVIGEILAGVLLGPTVFGAMLPDIQGALFPATGPVSIALDSLGTLAIALFLLVAGMEVDLSTVWRQGRTAVLVGLFGILIPFLLGFVPAFLAPNWFGLDGEATPVLFAMFFATAMSITALPVIAKILMDLKLFQSELGVTIVSAAILNDLAGWIIFAFVLSQIGVGEHVFNPWVTALLTVGFAIIMLTFGRWAVNRMLPWIQAHTEWPAGMLGFALSLTMLAAAFTEWIGVHAIFGAFMFGVALGDSAHLRRRTRTTIDQFVSFIFAPIFFASIGLRVNFAAHFDALLVIVVLLIASAGKIFGCTFAARWAGFERRESWAVGFGMNARGAMEIVLGLLALQAGIISERLFVALVVMALVTSMSSGYLIQRSFGRKRSVSFLKYLTARGFLPAIDVVDRFEAIRRLTAAAAEAAGIDPAVANELIVGRESVFNSSMGHGVAIPHARLDGLTQPAVAFGLCPRGIEWDTPDGLPVHVVIVVISPSGDPALQLALLASVARAFHYPESAAKVAASVSTLTELRAYLRVESTQDHEERPPASQSREAPRPDSPAAAP